VEQVVCIICGEKNFSHFLNVKCKYSNEVFSLNKCKCSLVLTSPRPSEDNMNSYYQNQDYQPHAKINSYNSFFDIIFKKISHLWKYNFLDQYIKKDNPTAIDIGGGDGSLAIYLNKRNIRTDVYEKESLCVEFIKGYDIFASSSFSDFKDNNYDLVMLWHSLEHIHDIDELFSQINRISNKDALMTIATPNISAGEIKFLKENWVAWDVPRHLYHFNYNTLNMLLTKYGWEITNRKSMFQDTLFNIYAGIHCNFIVKIIIFCFISVYSLIVQIFSINKVSSNLIVCKKK